MTQPQQPFGEARACTAVADPCAYCGRPIGDIGAMRIAGQRFHWQCTQPPAQPMPWAHPAPMRETAEPVDAAAHERRIAALEDETRRLWRALAAAQKAQAL